MVQQKQSHEGNHASQHGNAQVCGRGAQSSLGFVVGHPGIAGHGHDFKKHEGGVQIVRIEQANGGAQGDQREKVVTVFVFGMAEIFAGKLGGNQPEERRHQGIDAAEAVCPEGEAQGADARQGERKFPMQRVHLEEDPRGGQKLRPSDCPRQGIPNVFPFASRQISRKRTQHGQENHKNNHMEPPAMLRPWP